jgi:hypothetical protein
MGSEDQSGIYLRRGGADPPSFFDQVIHYDQTSVILNNKKIIIIWYIKNETGIK